VRKNGRATLLCLLFAAAVSGSVVVAQDGADATAQGIKLLDDAVRARGGERYLSFKSLIAEGQFTPFDKGASLIPTPFLDMIVYPDKERVEFGKGKKKDRRIQANSGLTGWVYDGDNETLKDQTDAQRRDFVDGVDLDLDRLLRGGWKESGVRVRFAGREETRPGERADVVEVELRSGRKAFILLDRYTHLPLSLMYEKVSDQVLSKNEYRFAQYVGYDGVQFPNIVDFYQNGVQVSRVNYQSIKLNIPVEDAVFAKPANAKAIK
jgi:hypothetical protein